MMNMILVILTIMIGLCIYNEQLYIKRVETDAAINKQMQMRRRAEEIREREFIAQLRRECGVTDEIQPKVSKPQQPVVDVKECSNGTNITAGIVFGCTLASLTVGEVLKRAYGI